MRKPIQFIGVLTQSSDISVERSFDNAVITLSAAKAKELVTLLDRAPAGLSELYYALINQQIYPTD
jgi:hypothetical protein